MFEKTPAQKIGLPGSAQEPEIQKDRTGTFEWVEILGAAIIIIGAGLAILFILVALDDGEEVLFGAAISILVSSLILGALLKTLGAIGLELTAIRKSVKTTDKPPSE